MIKHLAVFPVSVMINPMATISKLNRTPFCKDMKLDSFHCLIQKESLCGGKKKEHIMDAVISASSEHAPLARTAASSMLHDPNAQCAVCYAAWRTSDEYGRVLKRFSLFLSFSFFF